MNIPDLARQVRFPIPTSPRLQAGPRTPLLAIYKTATAQVFTTNTDTVVNFDTLETDTHKCVTVGAAWKFTAPYTMICIGAAQIQWEATTAWAAGELTRLALFKNGADLRRLGRWDSHVSGGAPLAEEPLGAAFMVYLEKGETLSVVAYQNTGGDLKLYTNAVLNRIEIFGLPA